MALSLVTLQGTYDDGEGHPLKGYLQFVPSAPLTDTTDPEEVRQEPVAVLLREDGTFSVALYATDNADLAPAGWCWQVTEYVTGLAASSWAFFLAFANGPTQDISALTPVSPAPAMTAMTGYLPVSGGTITGPLTLPGNPTAPLQAAPKQYVDAETTRARAAEAALLPLSSLPLALTSGGTGAGSAGAALTSLGAAGTANNLSDLTSASTARTNLGLGSAATQGTSAFDAAGTAASAVAPVSNNTAAIFSPMNYGATGNGTADDTPYVQAAFTAAAAAGGIVDLGTRTFLTSSPVPLASGVHLRGSGLSSGGLINRASDLFSVTSTVAQFTIENCYLYASAGHIFNCASGSQAAMGKIVNVQATQASASCGIWYMPVNGLYIDMLVGDGCILTCAAGATVAPWTVVGPGSVNSNTWRRMRVYGGGSPGVPFFHVESSGASSYASDNVFQQITAEQCPAGIITALGCTDLVIENVAGYDVSSYSASLFTVGTGSGGANSSNVTIRESGRRGGSLGSGAYDVSAPSCSALLLSHVGPESGVPSYNITASQATIMHAFGDTYGIQAAAVTVSGVAGTNAPVRLAGGSSTITGPPTTGTWNFLDIWADATGALWVCHVPGTPGTWVSGLSLTGGTMTGPLILAADPGVALGAATKQYVDNSEALLAPTPAATESVIYVSAASSASDGNNGLTFGAPKATIAGALAALGSNPGVVQLGAGTFTISAADGSGNGVTLANIGSIIRGAGRALTLIDIATTVTFGILCQAAYCEVRDLTVQTVSGGTCTYGIGVDTPGPSGSAEHCLFQNLWTGEPAGTLTNGYAVGPTHTGTGAVDIAETYFIHCVSQGAANAGFLIGNGTVANILNTFMIGCDSNTATYGIYCASSIFMWDGGTLQHNTYDIYVAGNASGNISTAQNFRSENSGTLLSGQSGYGGVPQFTLKNVTYGSPVPVSTGVFISWGYQGVLNLENIKFATATSGAGMVTPVIVIGNSPTAVNATGIQAAAPMTQLFSTSSASKATVQISGYIQLDPATNGPLSGTSASQGSVTLFPSTATATINSISYNVMQPAVPLASGLPGATQPSRWVGATTGGAPTSGTFLAGDFAVDPLNATFWICTTGGTHGTWASPVPGVPSEVQPSDIGVVAWTGNPGKTIGGVKPAAGNAGVLLLWLLRVPVGGTITHISYGLDIAGVTMANTFLGLYSAGSSATLLASCSTDQSANMTGTAGPVTATLDTPGPYAASPGLLRIGLLIGSAATMPTFTAAGMALSGPLSNTGLPQPGWMVASTGSGQTSLPAGPIASTAFGQSNVGLPVFVFS